MKYKLSDLLNQVLYLIYPRRCAFCGEVVSPQTRICDECEKTIEFVQEDIYFNIPERTFFSDVIAPFYYSGGVKKCILGLKFQGLAQNADILAEYMVDAVKTDYNDKNFDMVVCVPLTKRKKRKRGYNQSDLIAKKIAQELNLDYEEKILLRAFEKIEQKKLTKNERLYAILSAFELKDNLKIKGKTILLCDDVVTTGATLNECSKVLVEGGAKEVYCVTGAVVKGR